ncbi:MAG: DUF4139 domain-containing protein [Bacteroidia bacterium]|nr:DUF4139 domain-containing protein [Bacteroidia bacterium]
MKKLIFVLAASILGSTCLKAEEKEIIVNDQIKSVTVFMQNAQLFKQAYTSIPKGTSHFVFNDVSPYINKASIQVAGIGKFTILNTQYRYYMETPNNQKSNVSPKFLEREKVLKDSLQNSQLRINKNSELMNAIEQERNLIMANPLVKGTSNSDSLELLKGTANFLRKELKELAQMKYVLSIQAKKMANHHKKLKHELRELRQLIQNQNIQPTPKYHHQVIVTVLSQSATNGTIKLNYLSGNAGWNPHYDLIAKDHQSDITLIYKAQVYQNTGKDWNQVKVKVSNANPNQGNTKPKLPIWFVNFQRFIHQDRAKKGLYLEGNAVSAKSVSMESVSEDDMEIEEEASMLYEYTNKVQNFSSVEFDIALPMNVSSGGKPHYMDLKSEKVSTKFQLYLVPKLEKDAFVVARLTDWESLDLLTGQANIYYGNTFIGRTVVNPSVTDDTLEVSMGRDRSVYVERKKTDSQTKKKLIENSKVYSADYVITIKNKNRGEVHLTIEDHIPVSKNDKIEITSTHGNGKLNKETGVLSWDINLKGLEKKQLDYGFSLKYPKDEILLL